MKFYRMHVLVAQDTRSIMAGAKELKKRLLKKFDWLAWKTKFESYQLAL